MGLGDSLARFRRNFWQSLLSFSRKGIRPVAANEDLRRFLTVDRWVGKDGRIKPNAFLPRQTESGTSMYRVLDCPERRLWALGASIAAGTRDGTLYGQARIRAEHISAQKLTLAINKRPTLHVDVTGWPSKSEGKLIAEKLAERATLLPAPPRP